MQEIAKISPTEVRDLVAKNLNLLKLRHWLEALDNDLAKLDDSKAQVLLSHLQKCTSLELSERHTDAIRRRIESAKFIRLQTVDQFDFEFNPSTRALKAGYLKLHNEVRQKALVPRMILVGNTGLGKTHLARAMGYTACQAGLSVLFTRASQIVNALSAAKATNTLENELKKYRRPQLLIIDELGYVTMDIEASNLFFQVITDRHDRGLGTIVTTNFAFGHWNQIFASDSTAVVIVERLTTEAEVFYVEGPSYNQQKRKAKSNK